MYNWVIPPEMLSRLWEVKQRTRVPIARQIREAVQAYLSEAEAKPVAASETFQQTKEGDSS
jgi:predicted DNA-binding protein